MGCFPADFQEAKRPLKTKSGIEVRKRPIKEGKRPIKAMVLIGVSVGCLMGCFQAPPPWWKTAPLKRSTKRSMIEARSGVYVFRVPRIALQEDVFTLSSLISEDFPSN